jgi:HicB family
MGTFSLRLPESLHKQARELAKQEDISINQLISTALAEKMSALMTSDYLKDRCLSGRPTEIPACSKEGAIAGPASDRGGRAVAQAPGRSTRAPACRARRGRATRRPSSALRAALSPPVADS